MIRRIPSVLYMKKPKYYVGLPGTPRIFLALHRSNFDVLHVHSPLTVGMLAFLTARFKNVPLIYTYHTSITDYTHYIKVGGKTRPIGRATRWFSTATANMCNHVVVPSVKYERLLEEQNVRRPIHTIPNGIDLNQFEKTKTSGILRHGYSLSTSSPILLYVGRLDPEKCVDLLTDAFSTIGIDHPTAHLFLAGDGASRSILEAKANQSTLHDQIHFLGMVNHSELPDILHDATLFLSASTSETQCLAMIEAIVSGLPIVAVRDEAFKGILVDGFNGRATPRSVRTFAIAVSDLLKDSEAMRHYRKNSLKLSRNYSIKSQVDSLVKLYRDAILENHGQ